MIRKVTFKKYRNIGIEENESFILNYSNKEKEMGNLIVLLGPNNSGKSNILDGIESINIDYLTSRDKTNLKFEEKYKEPEIILSLSERDNEKEDNSLKIKIINDDDFELINKQFKEIVDEFLNKGHNLNSFSYILDDNDQNNLKEIIEKYRLNNNQDLNIIIKFANIMKKIKIACDKMDEDYNNKIEECKKVGYYRDEEGERYYEDEIYNEREDYKNFSDIRLYSFLEKNGFLKNIEISFSNLSSKNKDLPIKKPFVARYNDKNKAKIDSNVRYVDLSENDFFKSIFKSLEIDLRTIENVIKEFEEYKNDGTLDKINKVIQKKIINLSEKFNNLFKTKSEYSFNIKLKEDKISFYITEGKNLDVVIIDWQSTGFKWFFNFYFGFLMQNELRAGDILILDEPGNQLHWEGQKELKKIIKEYAVNNDITILIATHSPAFVDYDNYEELRLVEKNDEGISRIFNSFVAVDDANHDTLVLLKESMTIQPQQIYQMENKIIWVEGISDYSYLTLFKKILNYENISFIPFNGTTKNPDSHFEKVLKQITKYKFYNSNIFFDADKNGLSSQKISKDTQAFPNALSLKDVFENDNIKVIEDLFSDEDKNRYKFINSKETGFIKIVKDRYSNYEFSESTKNNFKKLLDTLIEG